MTQATATARTAPTLRAQAAARLAELGLPTVKLEEWRFTNPAAITRVAWCTAEPYTAEPTVFVPATTAAPAWSRHAVATVDGRLVTPVAAPGLAITALPADDTTSLPDAYGTIAPADAATHSFVLHNTARATAGVHVRVADGAAIAAPVVIAHGRGIRSGEARIVVTPRVLLEVGAGATVTVVEDFRGLTSGDEFTNAVTEVVLAAGATCTLVRLVGERAQGFHVGLAAVRLARDARFTARTFAPGGPIVRDDLRVLFAGEGGEAHLDGLFTVTGNQVVDHHTILDHAAARCTSREYYKGVLTGAGHGVFNGAVLIRTDAQKSDSNQRSMNLLLSNDATIDTKPELQIYADDVKCGHGATVGRLDDDALFYLRARGIGANEARALLVRAFAGELVDRVEHDGLRAEIGAWIGERMDRVGTEVA